MPFTTATTQKMPEALGGHSKELPGQCEGQKRVALHIYSHLHVS